MLESGILRNFEKFLKKFVTFHSELRLLIQERQLLDVPVGQLLERSPGQKMIRIKSYFTPLLLKGRYPQGRPFSIYSGSYRFYFNELPVLISLNLC